MDLELQGKVLYIGKEVQVTDKFKKRDFVVETDEKYPQKVKFELVQDKCSKADFYEKGDWVRVKFNVRGREWANKDGEVKYFVSLNAWWIEKLGGETATKKKEQPSQANEDLPF